MASRVGDLRCPYETSHPTSAEPRHCAPIPAAPPDLPQAGTARRSWLVHDRSPTPHPVRGTGCSRWGRDAGNCGNYGDLCRNGDSPPPAARWRNERTKELLRRTSIVASVVLPWDWVPDRPVSLHPGFAPAHTMSFHCSITIWGAQPSRRNSDNAARLCTSVPSWYSRPPIARMVRNPCSIASTPSPRPR